MSDWQTQTTRTDYDSEPRVWIAVDTPNGKHEFWLPEDVAFGLKSGLEEVFE